jgi:hypothetical protein
MNGTGKRANIRLAKSILEVNNSNNEYSKLKFLKLYTVSAYFD